MIFNINLGMSDIILYIICALVILFLILKLLNTLGDNKTNTIIVIGMVSIVTYMGFESVRKMVEISEITKNDKNIYRNMDKYIRCKGINFKNPAFSVMVHSIDVITLV